MAAFDCFFDLDPEHFIEGQDSYGTAECKVCGKEFKLMASNHYLADSIAPIIGAAWPLHDAFDCPHCGCQYLAGPRAIRAKELRQHRTISEMGIMLSE